MKRFTVVALAASICATAQVRDEPFAIALYGGAGNFARARLTLERAAGVNAVAKVRAIGGRGGVIALDHSGEAVFSFTTEGMNRGFAKGTAKPEARVFR